VEIPNVPQPNIGNKYQDIRSVSPEAESSDRNGGSSTSLNTSTSTPTKITSTTSGSKVISINQ
jgi:hypothetical protein